MMTTVAISQTRNLPFTGLKIRDSRTASVLDTPTSLDQSPLHRLIQITQSNDRLVKELITTRRRLVQAFEYASDPAGNHGLGEALVLHARRKYDRVRDRLRANRVLALAILAGLGDRD